MAQNIGNLAVQLSLDAVLFTQGLDKSTKEGQQFANNFSKTFAAIGAGTAVGGEIGGGFKFLYDEMKSGLSEIVAQGEAAHRLGLSLEGLAAVHLLAGADAEKMDHALLHLSRTMSEATQGNAEAKGVFQSLHLDAAKLAALPMDTSLGKIVDRINELGSAADRSNVGMKLFGREGVDILEKLRDGSIGVAEAVAKIKAHGGVGFGEKDVANAIEAQRSFTEMENTFGRIKLTLVSEFAPVLKQTADWVADIAGPAGGGLRNAFHSAALSLTEGMDAAVAGAEQLVISAHRMEVSFDKIGAVAKATLGVAPDLYGAIHPLAEDAFEKEVLRQGKKFHDAMNASRHKLEDLGLDKKGKDAAPAAVGKGGEALDKFAGPIDALEKKLENQLAAFGLAGDAAERFKLATDGAAAGQLGKVDALIGEITSLTKVTEQAGAGLNIFDQYESQMAAVTRESKKFADAQDFAARASRKLNEELSKKAASRVAEILKDTAGEFDKLKAQAQEIMTLGDRFGLGKEAGFAELGKQYMNMAGSDATTHAPGAALKGSTEDYSAIVQFQREQDNGAGNVQERIRATLERQEQLHKLMVQYGEQIANAFTRLGVGKLPG